MTSALVTAVQQSTMAVPSQPVSIIERMPTELRLQVYGYLLHHTYTTHTKEMLEKPDFERWTQPRCLVHRFHTQIFRVNKAIGYESFEFFHQANDFVVVSSNRGWFTSPAASTVMPIVSSPLIANLTRYQLKVHLDVDYAVSKENGGDLKFSAFAAAHLKLFTKALRRGMLFGYRTFGVKIHLDVRQLNLLKHFHRLHYFNAASISGVVDAASADGVKRTLESRPPIGHYVLKEVERLEKKAIALTETEGSNKDADSKLSTAQSLLLTMVGLDLPEHVLRREIGCNIVWNELKRLFLKLEITRTLVKVKLGDFGDALKRGNLTLNMLLLLPALADFPAELTARLYYHLALAHLGIAEVEASPPNRRRNLHLVHAFEYLVRGLEIAPNDLDIKGKLDALRRQSLPG
ncbi:MAG: hypothetical protein Q9187_003205 [Circinaria calcarea]